MDSSRELSSELRQLYRAHFEAGHSTAYTARVINVGFMRRVTSAPAVHYWFKKFKFGHFELTNLPRGRAVRKVNKESLKEAISSNVKDRPKSLRELAKELNVSHSTIAKNLRELGEYKSASRGTQVTELEKIDKDNDLTHRCDQES